jgi:hypothetical protein
MLDRVVERRRAAQLARHYRDREGLSIAERPEMLVVDEKQVCRLAIAADELLACEPPVGRQPELANADG